MNKILSKIDKGIAETSKKIKTNAELKSIIEDKIVDIPIKQPTVIIENKKKDNLRFIVLSDEPENQELFHTARRIVEEAPKLGHGVYAVFIDGAYITNNDGIKRIHNIDDKKGFVIDNSDTVAIVRGSITRKDSWLDLLTQIEKANICCVNSRQTVNTCADKYRTYLRLADFGLTQPKTVLIPNAENVKIAMENLDTKYPVIVKTLRGSKGIGVIFIESERSLEAIVQLIYKDDELELLLQEYIKTDFDVRVLVLGGKIIASMERDVIEGDFRSNYSRGGKVKNFKLTELEIEQCILAAKAVNGLYVGVDFIPSKNRDKEPPYILEVNSSPGTEGIEKATDENLISILLQHFDDPKNRFSVPIECGYRETINIEPFGNIIAKFDTGNTGYNVIHAENIKVDGSNVSWSLLDKKVTSKIIDKVKVDVGGLRDNTEERYLVNLDVTFLGVIYKNITFTLDDRNGRSSVLLCRDFMSKLNVMINPRRKFIITTKYSLKEK
jgi:ribosomal protein S6--L-glutamate ligase